MATTKMAKETWIKMFVMALSRITIDSYVALLKRILSGIYILMRLSEKVPNYEA